MTRSGIEPVTKLLQYFPHLPSVSHAPLNPLTSFDYPNDIWRGTKIKQLHVRQFFFNLLHPPPAPSLLFPNSLCSKLFSNILNVCTSLSVRDQRPYPYKTKAKLQTFILSCIHCHSVHHKTSVSKASINVVSIRRRTVQQTVAYLGCFRAWDE